MTAPSWPLCESPAPATSPATSPSWAAEGIGLAFGDHAVLGGLVQPRPKTDPALIGHDPLVPGQDSLW